MIEWQNITEFDSDTPEGKVLLAAISILSSIECEDIKENKWGGMVHPDDALKQVVELANKIYYEEEWKLEQERIKRDNTISKVLDK